MALSALVGVDVTHGITTALKERLRGFGIRELRGAGSLAWNGVTEEARYVRRRRACQRSEADLE